MFMPDAIRILHAEDDPDFADLTATYLQREDERFEVTTASDTTVAHEHLATHEFDCIVSDHDMPGENGIEFLTSVRAEFPDLPFILFTGKGSEEVASEAISAGVTDYLQKATGAEQYELLANRIGTAVEQYRTKSRLERQNDLFRQAQDIATIGAWEYDVESDQTYVTDELLRIHGLGLDVALPPEKSLSYYHPEDRELVADAFNRAIDTGESYDLEARLITEDGRKRWVRTRGVPQSEDGNTVRLRGILQDITEQKHREVNLERQNERL